MAVTPSGPSTSEGAVGGRPAVGNVLGFSMLLSGGQVLLRLDARALATGVRLVDYEAAVVGVELPLSGELTAQAFRQHRCRVRRLALQIERRTLLARLAPRLLEGTPGTMTVRAVELDLTARLDPSGEPRPAIYLEGHVDGCATWVAIPVALRPMGTQLVVDLGAPWVLGRCPLDPAPLLEAVASLAEPRDALLGVGDRPPRVDPIATLRRPFVEAGWKVPDASGVSLVSIRCDAQQLELVFGPTTTTAETPLGQPRRPGAVDRALERVRRAQQAKDVTATVAQLEDLADALVHHDRARIQALRWLAETCRAHDPARCMTALRVWLHLAPTDRTAMRMLIALTGRHGGGRELAQRLMAACRFPNPGPTQARLELSLANVLVDHLGDRYAARALVDPLAQRLESGAIDAELATDVWTCVAKAHADDPRAVDSAVAKALATTERAAERASVQFAAGRALAEAGHEEPALQLLSSAATLAPDEPGIVEALRELGGRDEGPTDTPEGPTSERITIPLPELPAGVIEPEPEPEPEPPPRVLHAVDGEAQPDRPASRPTLAVVQPPPPIAPAPTATDVARRDAWEAYERDGDEAAAIAIIEDALRERPTDALLLSTLKSIAGSEFLIRYLDALQHAMELADEDSERDRWATELAMAAVEHDDVERVATALSCLSAAASDSLEAMALRDWVEQQEQPERSAAEPRAREDATSHRAVGASFTELSGLAHPEQGESSDAQPDAVRLESIARLVAKPDAGEVDPVALRRLASSVAPDQAARSRLHALADSLRSDDPRLPALTGALLGHALALEEPRFALAAIQQASEAQDDRPLEEAWPRLRRIVLGRGDEDTLAALVATIPDAPVLAAEADDILEQSLSAFPDSQELHETLRQWTLDTLSLDDAPDAPAAVDRAVLERIDAIADRRRSDPIEHARLVAGAAACMAGPAAATVLAERAASTDWRGPAFIVLLDALERAGHWPQVIALHERRAETAATGPERLDARKRLAHIYAEVLGDAGAAVTHLEAALTLSPSDPDLLLPLLDHHFAQKDLSRAVELTARVLDYVRMGDAAFASLAHRAADAAIAMGDPVTAAELLSRVVSRNPADHKAAARLTELELMAGDPQRRIELLGSVADRQAGKARVEALEERARLLLAGDRPEAAMDDLATVCREAPERTDSVRRLAALYREHDRHEALVTLYEMQLQRRHGVDKIEPLMAIAELHNRHTGDLGRAEAALRIGLEHASDREDDPQRIELEDALIDNLERQGRFADLAAWLETRLAETYDATSAPGAPPSPRRCKALARLAALNRDYLAAEDAAATIYRRLEAHGMLPDDGLATLARWYRKERRHEDLVRVLVRRAEALADSGHIERRAQVERWIAELLEGPLGRPQDAATHYLEAYLADIEGGEETGARARVLLSGTDSIANVRQRLHDRLEALEPARHPALLVLLADLLSPHDGYEAEAEACYRRALEGEPGLAGAYEGLGRLLLRCDRPEDAARALVAAVRSEGLPPARAADVAALAARALSEQGRTEQAESILRLALTRVPDSQRALMELVEVHEKAGRPDAQADVLEHLATLPLSGARHAEVAFRRAMLLREAVDAAPRGPQGERARSLLLEAVSADPRHPAARKTLVALATAREEWAIVAHMHYLTIRELPPGAQRAAAHLDLAEVYLMRLRDPDSCMRNIESALQQASDDIVIATRTTELARRMPDPKTAAEHFEQVAGGDNELDEAARARLWLLAADLRMDDADPEASVDTGIDAAVVQVRQQARELSEERERGMPHAASERSPEQTDRLRELLASRGDYDAAVDLSRVLAEGADPARAAHLLTEAAGFAWHALREPVRAATLLGEALVHNENHEAASAALDELTRLHEADDEGPALLSALAEIGGRNPPPGVSLARATLTRARGNYAGALLLLRPLLESSTDASIPVVTRMGALLLADRLYAGRGDRARRLEVLGAAFELGLARDPSRVGDVGSELARLHRELGDATAARTVCDQASTAAHEHRGLLQLQAELYEEDGDWGALAQIQVRLAKVALDDDEQAMWLTRAARTMLAHPEATADRATPRRLLVRACAVAPSRAEPRSLLLPLSFFQSRWRETLELADELRSGPEARGELEDHFVLAALAEAYHAGGRDLAGRMGPPTDERIDLWLLPGVRHVLDEVAVRGPLPRLDYVLSAAVRICGSRVTLLDSLSRWALQHPVAAGVSLGMGRLHEAQGDAVRARHLYQIAAFLAPEGAVPGLVARLPGANVPRLEGPDLAGGSSVRSMAVALRDHIVGLPWAEAFTSVPPRESERPLVEQVQAVLEPFRRVLSMELPVSWVVSGPKFGIAARAGSPVPGVVVSPAIGELSWAERAFRLASSAIQCAMGLAALAPPGPDISALLDAYTQHLRPGYEATTEDARTIAETLRKTAAPRDPLGPGRRGPLLDELSHHRADPSVLTAEVGRRIDVLATTLSGRLDGALMAIGRDAGLLTTGRGDRVAVARTERAQWLLRALMLR